ncbi:MAG: hypothetical protein PHI35_05910 [Victivallaceae bacterium]|nr:hypothetical protein [Victivallaceae bacterium]
MAAVKQPQFKAPMSVVKKTLIDRNSTYWADFFLQYEYGISIVQTSVLHSKNNRVQCKSKTQPLTPAATFCQFPQYHRFLQFYWGKIHALYAIYKRLHCKNRDKAGTSMKQKQKMAATLARRPRGNTAGDAGSEEISDYRL